MASDNLLILPSFSLQPNKLVGYNSVFRRDYINELLVPIQSKVKTVRNHIKFGENVENLKKKRSELVLSDNAYRTLRKKINWLYYLSKSKYKKTYSGKEIFNFKINFITLTLPSKQKTPTIDCNNLLLNHFLTEIRQRTKMTNYVWRLEFQDNGNVHYHIVTDTYLDYFFIKKIWNRILKNTGYIEEYKRKFENMTFGEYWKSRDGHPHSGYADVSKAYTKAKSENWEQPNSVDVKSVVSKKAISNYISKYFCKKGNNKIVMNELDNNENIQDVRLWFCSRSLSRLNTISHFMEEVVYDLFEIVKADKDVKVIFMKYAKVVFFEITKMIGESRKFIEMLLKDYSRSQGYIPSD